MTGPRKKSAAAKGKTKKSKKSSRSATGGNGSISPRPAGPSPTDQTDKAAANTMPAPPAGDETPDRDDAAAGTDADAAAAATNTDAAAEKADSSTESESGEGDADSGGGAKSESNEAPGEPADEDDETRDELDDAADKTSAPAATTLTESKAATETQSEPPSDREPEFAEEPTTEISPQGAPDERPAPSPEPQTEPEPEPEPQPEPEPLPEPTPEQDPEPEPGPESLSEPEPAPEPESKHETREDSAVESPPEIPPVSGRRRSAPIAEPIRQFTSRAERNGYAKRPRGKGTDHTATADASGAPSARRPARVGGPADAGRRTFRGLRRFILLALLAAIVLSLGTVLIGPGHEIEGPTATEIARAQALKDIHTLHDQLAGSPILDAPEAVQSELTGTTDMLALQAQLLSPPPPASGATSIPSVKPTTNATAQPALASPASAVDSLTELAARNLATAERIEPGMARLLASIGAGQLVQAVALAEAAELQPPAVPSMFQGTEPTAALCSTEPSNAPTAEAGSEELNAAAGMQAAVGALQRIVYAYEVFTTQFPEPAFSVALERLGEHRSMLETALGLAAAHCIDVPLSDAGYALPNRAAQSPQEYLALAETQLAAVCADLVGLSSQTERVLGISCLTEAAVAGNAWDGDTPASPGLDLPAPGTSSPDSGRPSEPVEP